jgi:exopolyphosphatase/guanosine-5'-triphosphate,3'-diphosphate pyrophosphatase
VQTRAVIDVGTNSVKLLVASVDGRSVHPVLEESKQTRLGQGFYETHQLQKSAIEQTAKAVAEFVEHARRLNPASIKIIATSAARDAANKETLIGALETATRLKVIVITGEQEAEWAFQGVTSDAALTGKTLLVMDVGGGSTEFIYGSNQHATFSRSFSIGTVRLLEQLKISDPPLPAERSECERVVRRFLETEVWPSLEPEIKKPGLSSPFLVGTGGTISILSRIELQLRGFDRELMEKVKLTHTQIKGEKKRLWSLPLDKRKEIIGLPPNRADVILTGVVIFDQVMDLLGLETLNVSTRGLRFAALMD